MDIENCPKCGSKLIKRNYDIDKRLSIMVGAGFSLRHCTYGLLSGLQVDFRPLFAA